jgi:hypothetical protein
MSVIRTDAFSKTIRHAFASDGMFEEIRGPVRKLIAATDEISLEDIPIEEEVNDQVFVIGDDEEEGGMLKALCNDDEDSDPDNGGLNIICIVPVITKQQILLCWSLFILRNIRFFIKNCVLLCSRFQSWPSVFVVVLSILISSHAFVLLMSTVASSSAFGRVF